jgi:UDPglucose 6-dehydrogenase
MRVVTKVESVCGGSVAGKTVAAWGLTFKANTDDLRDSPAIKILTLLHDKGAEIVASDPTARGVYSNYPWITVADSAVSACDNADVLVVLTEWPQFVDVDPIDVGNVMKVRSVVDARNLLERTKWTAHGFSYIGVGR